MPPVLKESYEWLDKKVLNVIHLPDWASVTPFRFTSKGETVYFINNSQEFLFVTLPLSIIFFVFAWLLSKKVSCWILQQLLTSFATFGYLAISLFGDNIQYLSFRASQQLRFLVVRSTVEGVSVVLSILVLFTVVVGGCSVSILLWRYSR